MSAQFPDITVALLEQTGKPIAQISLVRQALQKAGHANEAREFTELAFETEEAALLELARRYVTVV
jgi:hypothetical protein